ncbi:MAG: serine/threonine-protein kinase [Halodesulfovibrio sp.]
MNFGTFILGRVESRFEEQGNFSDSYIATDLNLDKIVAVKDIDEDSVNGDAFTAFINEARLISKAKHTRICPILYAGQDATINNKYRIVTKYFKNGSLQGTINNHQVNEKTLDISYILKILLYVCNALENLHSERIIHNDIKPSNILLDEAFKPVLTDFGQSRFLSAPIIPAPATYWKNMSPEYLTMGVASFQSDIYQLGLLAYRLLSPAGFDSQATTLIQADPTGNTLKQAIIDGTFPNRREIPIFVSRQLTNFIKKALETNLDNRYNCIYDLQQDLAKIAAYPVHFNQETQTLSGNLNSREIAILIDSTNGRYDIRTRKNDRAVNGLSTTNRTESQARSDIAKALESLARH